jgi:hypothetical protein
MSVTTVFESRIGVFFGFGVTAIIVMMGRMTVMVGGKFVVLRRRMMMLGRMMRGFCHENVLGFDGGVLSTQPGMINLSGTAYRSRDTDKWEFHAPKSGFRLISCLCACLSWPDLFSSSRAAYGAWAAFMARRSASSMRRFVSFRLRRIHLVSCWWPPIWERDLFLGRGAVPLQG